MVTSKVSYLSDAFMEDDLPLKIDTVQYSVIPLRRTMKKKI